MYSNGSHPSDTTGLLQPLRPCLDTEWPDLKNPLVPNVNLQFWEREWIKHGTCSDFAHDPLNYFKFALQIRASLLDFKIKSGDNYKVEDVISLVDRLDSVEPEIACNVNRTTKVIQL
ncbi:hypothetical protein like AT1G14220 [Hibiscus trionum]|uniref:Uncharacterized protein n=1 Tax=Hibiscus trionum TaxID=183268 RepID=A0A9W7LWR0_HIBTR|nr:hypothetical protein like AT1G14220 [Hibiscus trionum]